MYENLLKLIQQAETADRIGKIENVVGMSMEASGGRSGIGDIVMIYNEAENCPSCRLQETAFRTGIYEIWLKVH